TWHCWNQASLPGSPVSSRFPQTLGAVNSSRGLHWVSVTAIFVKPGSHFLWHSGIPRVKPGAEPVKKFRHHADKTASTTIQTIQAAQHHTGLAGHTIQLQHVPEYWRHYQMNHQGTDYQSRYARHITTACCGLIQIVSHRLVFHFLHAMPQKQGTHYRI